MEIFKLIGRVMVDSSQAEQSLHKIDDKASKVSKGLGLTMKDVTKGVVTIAKSAVAIGKDIYNAVSETASALDEVDKGSIRMGITAERYQELAYAAGMCGVEMSTLEQAAKKLEKTHPGDTFDDALYTLMQVEDQTKRTEMAFELFGTAAYDLAPLLEVSQEEMEAMSEDANELGVVMSGKTVKAGAALGDLMSKVSQSVKGLKDNLVADLFPYVEKVLNWVLENMPRIRETITSVVDRIMPLISSVVDFVMQVVPPIFDFIMAAIDTILPYVQPVIDGLISLFTGFTALLKGDFEGFWEGLKGYFENIIPVIKDIGARIFSGLWDGMKAIWGKMADWINGIVDSITDWFSGIGKSVASFFGFGDDEADGSHASGIANVPYDGYKAVLHRGETVLNQQDSSKLLDMLNGGGIGGGNAPINITVQSVLDGRIIGESTINYMRKKERAMGI